MIILLQVPDIRLSIVLPQLKQIFPNHEDSQLQTILHDVNYNVAAATELILRQGQYVHKYSYYFFVINTVISENGATLYTGS